MWHISSRYGNTIQKAQRGYIKKQIMRDEFKNHQRLNEAKSLENWFMNFIPSLRSYFSRSISWSRSWKEKKRKIIRRNGESSIRCNKIGHENGYFSFALFTGRICWKTCWTWGKQQWQVLVLLLTLQSNCLSLGERGPQRGSFSYPCDASVKNMESSCKDCWIFRGIVWLLTSV